MNATIKSTGQTVKGKSLRDIQRQLREMLAVDGPRGLTAITDDGTEIHTELYDGQDYIRAASGRLLEWGGARTGAGRLPLSLYDRAELRVTRSTQLSPHKEFILADWDNQDEHLRWVITAPIKDILAWVAASPAEAEPEDELNPAQRLHLWRDASGE